MKHLSTIDQRRLEIRCKKLFNDDKSVVSFSGYHYSFETYQKVALKVGFESFTVLPLMFLLNPLANVVIIIKAFLKKHNTVVI